MSSFKCELSRLNFSREGRLLGRLPLRPPPLLGHNLLRQNLLAGWARTLLSYICKIRDMFGHLPFTPDVISGLLLLFGVWILYELLFYCRSRVRVVTEGLENQTGSTSGENTENLVEVLAEQRVQKKQVGANTANITTLQTDVAKLKTDVSLLGDQMNALTEAQQDYATQMTGGQVPEVTGI